MRKGAQRRGARIFFLDAAGFSSEPGLGRTYGLKGKTPVVQTSGQRQKVNAISAVNARGAFWSSVDTGMCNATRFVEFLKAVRRGRKAKVMLVVDGPPAHRAQCVKEHLASTRGGMERHFLPPDAPDLNPDEFVWRQVKGNGVSKKPLRQGESLKSRVMSDLARMKANKALVRAACFGAHSVLYARD